MDRVITNFIEAPFDKGNVMLVDMPPGTGKTYASAKAIAEYVKSGGERRIIFMTPQKKNLPGDKGLGELRRAFERAGIGDRYDECVIQLDSVTDHVLRHLSRMSDTDFGSMRGFLADASFVKRLERVRRVVRDLPYEDMKEAQASMLREDFSPVENELRRRIHRVLRKFDESSERLAYIKESESWLLRMYPEADVSNKQVVLLTSAKFAYPFDPIIEPPSAFYESSLLDGAVVFMDEFDSIKMDWLNQIINSENRSRINIVDLFCRIHTGLLNRENHSREYYREEESDDADGSRWSLTEFADKVAVSFQQVHDEHHLKYDFKLMEPDPNGFVFHDFNTITVDDGYFIIDSRKEDCLNRVERKSGKDGDEADYDELESLFKDMDRSLRFFVTFVKHLAYNYYNGHMQHGVSYEQSIRTVLEPFRLNKGQADYLVNEVKSGSGRSRIQRSSYDYSVYARGFTYYDFEDDDSHGLNSYIYQTTYHRSPEAILMNTLSASDVKIIGMSATATLATCVRNFDLDYLRYTDEFNLYEIPEEDEVVLQRACEDAMRGYDDDERGVDIVIEAVDRKSLANIEKDVRGLRGVLFNYQVENPYDQDRYKRFACAYRYFIQKPDIRSMICFMTLHAKPDGEFDVNVLEEICEVICGSFEDFDYSSIERTEGEGTPSEHRNPCYFEILRTDEFDAKKDEIVTRLAEGKKVFVLTSYQTVGAGQNLQYPVPDSIKEKIVHINDYKTDGDECKDFDAVYLDSPTNVVPTTIGQGKTEELARYLFDVEFLQTGSEIGITEAQQNIDEAFKRFGGSRAYPCAFKDTDSAMIGAVRDVIQAVGRLCRTSCKSPTVYVMADSRISDFMKSDISEYGSRLNKEFVKLYEEFHLPHTRAAPKAKIGKDMASEKANIHLSTLMNFGWDAEKMKEWGDLREEVLKHPTFPDGEGGRLAYNMYCKLDELSDILAYREKGRDIYLDPSFNEGVEGEVSAEYARLPELMDIPHMREWFEARGYATTFEPGTRIICPRLFKNVYLGALGETAVECILNGWDVNLNQIQDPERFEKFDFIADNGMYMDAKYWRGTPGDAVKNGLSQAFDKLRDGETAVIINVFKPEFDVKSRPVKHEMNGKTVWTVPYLYDGTAPNLDAIESMMEVFGCPE